MSNPAPTISYKQLFAFIWQFIRPHRFVFFIIFMVSFGWAVDTTVWPYILKIIIDVITQFDTTRSAAGMALILPVIYALLLWVVLQGAFCCQGVLLAKVLPKLETAIRQAMFEHVQRHSPKYFNEKFAGSLANKITDMTTQVSLIIKNSLQILVPTIGVCVLGALFFADVNPLFAFILIAWFIIHFSLAIYFARKCDYYENQHGEVRSALLGKIVDSFTNNFAVNLFFRFKHEQKWLEPFHQEEQRSNLRAKMYIEWMRLALGIQTFLIGGVVITGLTIYLWFQGLLTTGQIVQILNTTGGILMIMWVASFEIPYFFQALGTAKQALTVMFDPQDISDTPSAQPLKINLGEVIFDQVSFHYDAKPLFSNKNVHIFGGERVGLVGYSGAGKSTFVNLILRFFPVESGKILIDGQNIAHVTLESLRTHVALIPQDPILFHRTLEENIRYGNVSATKEQVIEVAKLAHCDEFIRRCPQGYDSLVGERGTKLSGGERQRIAIARAMLTSAPILILDEATSALDSVTEKYIQDSLDKLMHKRTTIVIAHRLSTLSKMDRILVFDQGRIVEEGSHNALLAKEGHYARMWNMQAGGFLPEKP
jgi:ATP-binding cassette subfamily B protein